MTSQVNGCTATDFVVVTQDLNPPTAVVAPPQTITCDLTQISLNGAGSSVGSNFTYNWTTNGGIILAGGNTLNPLVGGGGQYILTVTNTNNGCTASFPVVAPTNNNPPTANAGPQQTLTCVNNFVQLFGAGSSTGANFTYQWTTANGNIVSGGNTLFPIVDAPGTYTLTVENTVNGCTATSSTIVNVDAGVPLANAGPPQQLTCLLSQVQLNGTSSSAGPIFSYLWTTTNGNIVSGANTLTPFVNLPGTYQLTVTSTANGCQPSSFVTVTQDIVLPTVAIEPPGQVNCFTPQITLDASASSGPGNFSYVWNTATGNIVSGQGTLTPVVDQGGTYVLTITNNSTGCINGSGVTVTENIDNPTLVIDAPLTVSCTNPQVTLDASASSSGPDFLYTWTTVDGTIVSGADTPNPMVSSGGTYQLTILNQNTNCSSTDQVVVPEDANLPTVSLATPQGLNCTIQQIQLSAAIGNGNNLVFNWSTADGNFTGGQGTLQPTVDAPGTYVIEVENPATGCVTTDQVVVAEDVVIPATDAGPDGLLTCDVTSLELDGTASDNGPSLQYQWSTTDGNILGGGQTDTPLIDAPGTYVLQVLNTSSTCLSTDTVVVLENVIIPAAVAEPPILMGCLDPVVTLDATASTAASQVVYNWTTPNGNILSGDNTLQPQVDAPGDYTLTVLDTVNGCFASVSVEVIQDVELPQVDAGPGTELNCLITEYQLQAIASGQTGRFIYQWTTLDGLIANGDQTLNPLVTEAGTYTLTVVDTVNGCSSTANVEITQDINVPVADVSLSNPYNCTFQTVTLDGSGSTQNASIVFTWSTPNGNFIAGTNTLTPTVDLPGTYTLTINDTINDCLTSQTVQVLADTISPVLAIAQPDMLNCFQPEISLSGDAGGLSNINLSWTTLGGNFTGNQTTLNPNVDQPGVYILQVINLDNGCSSQTQTTVPADFSLPLVDAGPSGVINCADTVLTLSGNGDAGLNPISYLWTTADGSLTGGEDTPTPTVDAGGLYELTVTNLNNGCSNTAFVLIDEDVALPVADAGPQGLLNCYQPQIILDGSGSSSGSEFQYTWTTPDGNILSGADTPAPSVDAPGTYTLTVINTANQCVSSTAVAVIEDFTPPLADAGPAGELTCSITSLALSGSGSMGNFTYTWTTSNGSMISGANTLNPLINAPGDYELEVFNVDNGCSTLDQVTVTTGVSVPVALTSAADPITCADPQISLSGLGSDAGPNFVYNWTTPDGNIVSGGNTLTPLVDQPGVYTLTVTNTDNDCEAIALVDVPIDVAAPAVEAGTANLLTCTVLLVQLDGTGTATGADFTYQWTTTNGSISGGATTLNPVVDSPGDYELLVTNQVNGCSSTDMVTVEIDEEIPVAVTNVPGLLTCEVTELTLSADGSSSGELFEYLWSTTDGNILTDPTDILVDVDEPGTYQILVVNEINGCENTAIVTVGQDIVAPTVDAGVANELTCEVTSLSLAGSASGASSNLSYSWATLGGNIVSGGNTLFPQINQPGLYTLTVEDMNNGCTASDQVTVGEDTELPVVVIADPDILTCIVEEVILDANGSDNGPIFQLSWTTLGGNIVSGAQGVTPTVDAPGSYTLTILNTVNGCSADATVQVEEDIDAPVADAGAGFTLPCFDEIAFLSGSASGGGNPLEVLWTTTDGQIASGASTLEAGISSGGLYTLAVTDLKNGCMASDFVVIVEDIPFDPVYAAGQPPCYGDVGNLEILGVSGGTAPYVYSIDGGASFQSNPIFAGLAPGNYSIVIQDALGCETLPEAQAIDEPDLFVVDLGLEADLLQGETYQFQVLLNIDESEVASVVWSPTDGLSCGDCLEPVLVAMQTQTYYLTVVSQNGCLASDNLRVVVDERPNIYVPNVFSPNGDGENDIFYIFAREENIREIKTFLVFDRWGERVLEYYNFLPNNPAYGWDGAFRGEPLDPAVFVWFAEIEFIDGRLEIFKGDVTLVR